MTKNLLRNCAVNAVDKENCSALTIAAHHGFFSIVQLLLSSGANVQLSDQYGWSAFMHSVRNGHNQSKP
jgi:ankyrin repeat protein